MAALALSDRTKKNRKLNQLLSMLYHEGNKSIPDFSKSLHLSIPTVTRMLEELTEVEFIIQVGEGDSSGGRKPVIFGLNPHKNYVLAIDISRYSVRIAIVNLKNEFITEVKNINQGLASSADLLQVIKNESLNLIEKAGVKSEKILGAGITLPGLIDFRTGINYTYFSATGKSLKQLFSELFTFPVFVEHDTKAMALAESVFGLAKGKENVLCIVLGSGIGMSMILGGRPYRGNSGFAGEFGHISVVENGQLCFCGKLGCLETIASGDTLLQNAREGLTAGAASIIGTLSNNNAEKISLDVILQAASLGDQFAISLLSNTGEALGKGLAILIHLFNPELIIIGGPLSKAGNLLLDAIRQTLNKHTIGRILKDTSIVTSDLGENAMLMGGIALAVETYFENEQSL